MAVMSYSRFQEISGACYVSRTDIEEKYKANPTEPWSVDGKEYNKERRESDASSFLDDLFLDENELDLEQISSGISKYREKMRDVRGPIWSTIGNVKVAVAKAASDSFAQYHFVLPEEPEIDFDVVRDEGKPSPYGDMTFPNFVEKPGEGFIVDGYHPADYQAAAQMYEGNLLALLLAREYDFEETMP
tara:strand:+ start:186 stop:749 length:564 start_codon:yes stop_codon:yes gene_type:complete